MNQQKTIIGIYHKSCNDGTAAAAVLLKKFPQAQLFPLGHNYVLTDLDPIRNIKEIDEIYFVDCAIGINELLAVAKKVTVIDHHISIKEELDALAKDGKINYIFDNKKSGSSLAWSYFFPAEPIPEIIKYVEDSDLWNWAYGETTKYVTNYLSLNMNMPEVFLSLFGENIEHIKKDGSIITRYADSNIERIMREVRPIKLKIGDHEVFAYNVTMYQSAVGNNLSKQIGGVVTMFTIKGEKVKLDFRCGDGHEPSAIDLATLLGGGGHRNASGAEVPLVKFLEMIVR